MLIGKPIREACRARVVSAAPDDHLDRRPSAAVAQFERRLRASRPAPVVRRGVDLIAFRSRRSSSPWPRGEKLFSIFTVTSDFADLCLGALMI